MEVSEIEGQLTPARLRAITEKDDLEEVDRIELAINTEVITLSELGSCLVNLVELKLTTPTYMPTLRKLGTMDNLKILWASAVGLENIDGTSGLTSLTELYISYNQISDLSPLAYLENLEVLDLESNYVESGLELRYLSFCTKLTNLSMSGCPIAGLPDYRRIVLSRLPPGSILDDESEIQKSIIEENSIFTTDDAILLKELVADGLLDEDELLENEPVTRPFTAMGLRPKTTQFTPFQRPSSAFKRPVSNDKPLERSRSDLTQGSALQGPRSLLSRFKGGNNNDKMNDEIKDKLRNMKNDNLQRTHEIKHAHEVNILKLDDSEPIPERSKLARSIRTSSTLEQGDSLSSDESSTTEQEPKKKTVPKLKKELNPLRTTLPSKIKSVSHENVVKLSSSRQEQLLAESGVYKQVNLPIIKPMAKKSELQN